MNRRHSLNLMAAVVSVCIMPSAFAADPPPAKPQAAIDKGLAWLSKTQAADGHWSADGQYGTTMTALAGLAMLAEGSTPGHGKYGIELDKATKFIASVAQSDGLLCTRLPPGAFGRFQQPAGPQVDSEGGRYLFGHGYALLFLSQVYAKEKDESRRKDFKRVLDSAIAFSAKAQTSRGGWGYISAEEGQDFDEGAVTVTQILALRAARDAGLEVPKACYDKAQEYLRKSSTSNLGRSDEQGIVYSLTQGGGNVRPALTVAALACLKEDELKTGLAVKWFNFCEKLIALDRVDRDNFGYWEFTHFHFAQVLHRLGEDGHAQMRPDLAEQEKKENKPLLLKWSRYKDALFDRLAAAQTADGSWAKGQVGAVYTTATRLIVLQLDKGELPFCKR